MREDEDQDDGRREAPNRPLAGPPSMFAELSLEAEVYRIGPGERR